MDSLSGMNWNTHRNGYDSWKVNDCLRILKALFNYGIDIYEISMKNPCSKIPFYKVKKKLKYIPGYEEIEEVQEKCNPRQALLIQFCLETGSRINEALRLEDKDIGEDYIVLYTNKTKEGREPRKLPMPPCLKECMVPEGRFFHEWSTKRTPHFLMNKANWGFHNLRHKFAIESMKKGKLVGILMYELGHSQLSTTTIYLKSLAYIDL